MHCLNIYLLSDYYMCMCAHGCARVCVCVWRTEYHDIQIKVNFEPNINSNNNAIYFTYDTAYTRTHTYVSCICVSVGAKYKYANVYSQL